MSLYGSLISPEPLPARSHHRFLTHLFSALSELLFPQLLCFHIHTSCRGAVPSTPKFCAFAYCSITNYSLSTAFSSVCELFGPTAKLKCLLFKKIQTLSAKHRGWPAAPEPQRRRDIPSSGTGLPAWVGSQHCAPTKTACWIDAITFGPLAHASLPSFEFRFSSFDAVNQRRRRAMRDICSRSG